MTAEINEKDEKYPFNYSSLLEEKNKLYMKGTRHWLFDNVLSWAEINSSGTLEEEDDDETKKNNLFLLVGNAGTGKTVVSTKLVSGDAFDGHDKPAVVGHHFFRYNEPSRHSPVIVMASISAMLKENLEGFAASLEDTKEINAFNLDLAIADNDQEGAFSALLGTPLKNMKPPSDEGMKILVFDALDELSRTHLNQFIRLLKGQFTKLPEWIGIFITSRPENNVLDLLQPKFRTEELRVDEKNNQTDLRLFLRHLVHTYAPLDFSLGNVEQEVERKFSLKAGSMSKKLDALEMPLYESKKVYDEAMKDVEGDPNFKKLFDIIKDRRDPSLCQSSKSLEDLYEQARRTQKMVGEWLKAQFGNSDGIELEIPLVKGEERAGEKIKNDYEGDFNKIRDVSRFTANCETVDSLCKAFEDLNKKDKKFKVNEDDIAAISVVQVKNKFESPSPLGHRDINLNLRVDFRDESYHLFEVQINLNVITKAKEDSHKHYEEIRTELPKIYNQLLGDCTIKEGLEVFERFVQDRLFIPTIDVLTEKLMAKASGLFQYGRLLEEHMVSLAADGNEKNIDFDSINALPSGLDDMYQSNFMRVFANGPTGKEWEDCLDFIAMVCAAREPPPKPLIEGIMGNSEFKKVHDVVSVLFSISQHDESITAIHKSLIDWLCKEEDDVNKRFTISTKNIANAHKILSVKCLKLCEKYLDQIKTSERLKVPEMNPEQRNVFHYAIRHAVTHACEAAQNDCTILEDVREQLLLNFNYLMVKVSYTGPYAATSDYRSYYNIKRDDRAIYLLKHALELSLPALYKDKRELVSQLLGGRLSMRYEAEKLDEIEKFLKEIGKTTETSKDGVHYWLPTSKTLLPAGNPCQSVLKGHTDGVDSTSFNHDGSRLCSGSFDNTVRIWNVDTGECLSVLEGHTDGVLSTSFNHDGSRLCSGSYDETVRIWNLDTGECLSVLEGHTSCVYSTSFNHDGSRLCSGSYDMTVRIWNVDTGECLSVLEGHTDDVRWTSFNHDGSRLCSGSWDMTVRIWNVDTGECLSVLEGHTSQVTSTSFNHDGSRLCSGSYDETVRIWNVDTAECLSVLEGHTWYVLSTSFNHDGSRLCSGSVDKTVRIWNVDTGECLSVLEDHTGGVTSTSFNHDGTRLCSGSWDKTVRIWNVDTGECFSVLERHTFGVHSTSFNHDGSQLCSVSADNTVRIWNVDTGECDRVLSSEEWAEFEDRSMYDNEGNYVNGCISKADVGFSTDGSLFPEMRVSNRNNVAVVLEGNSFHFLRRKCLEY